MPLKRREKVEVVAELKDRVQNSQIVILTHYIGINVEQVTELRKKLREAGLVFKVFKNTLGKLALDELDLSGAVPFMDGPTAWAFGADPTIAAKILKEFAKEAPMVAMTGGILEGSVVSKEQLHALAELPPRDVILARVVGTIAAPLRNLVCVLNALPRKLVNVLDQIRKQKQEAASAT